MTVATRTEDQPLSGAFMIVVVEGAPDLAASLAATLRREGFRTHIAGDAETGIEMTRSLRRRPGHPRRTRAPASMEPRHAAVCVPSATPT